MGRKPDPAALASGAGEDSLARHWSLTPENAAEALRARGTEHRLRCAVQLCTLRATGRLVSDYLRVPPEAVNHLARQLGLDPLLFLPDPERPATESAQLQRVRRHLGWHEFDDAAEQGLRARLQEHAAEGMAPGPSLASAEDLLRSARIVLPAASTLERLVVSVAAHAMQELFERIASGCRRGSVTRSRTWWTCRKASTAPRSPTSRNPRPRRGHRRSRRALPSSTCWKGCSEPGWISPQPHRSCSSTSPSSGAGTMPKRSSASPRPSATRSSRPSWSRPAGRCSIRS